MKSLKFLEVLEVPQRFFRTFLVWEGQSIKISQKVLRLFVHLMICEFFLLLQIVHLFTAKNVDDFADLMSVLVTFAAFSIKSIHFIKKRERIAALIEEAKDLPTLLETEDEKSLQRLNLRSSEIQKTFRFFLTSRLVGIFMLAVDTVATFIANPVPPYKIPFKFWSPFECQSNFYCFSFMTTYQITIIGVLLLEELAERLKKACKSDNHDVNRLKDFDRCISIHIKIKKFIRNCEKSFSSVIFAQGFLSTVIFCKVIFQLTEVKSSFRLKS